MPRISLLSNDSESLLRINKTPKALLSIDRKSPSFSVQVQLAFGHISSVKEAGNGSSYVKVGRELPKQEGSA